MATNGRLTLVTQGTPAILPIVVWHQGCGAQCEHLHKALRLFVCITLSLTT